MFERVSRSHTVIAITSCLFLIGSYLAYISTAQAANEANLPAFQRTWARTDQPVKEGEARTWMWGPEAFTGVLDEPYADSPDQNRQVQYFDKARMEITQPGNPDDGLWFVTNGLLVVEMISGNVQIGDDAFDARESSMVPVAGDPDDQNGPTYQSFAAHLTPVADSSGQTVVQQITRDGQIIDDPALADQAVALAFYDDITGHNIAGPFWDFMNSSGLIYQDSQYIQDQLFANPFYATGRPITEPYFADVKVAGTVTTVLIQCFERRCLTYTPRNDSGFQVEAGNVGLHYFCWRYGYLPNGKGQCIGSPTPQTPPTDNGDISTATATSTASQSPSETTSPGSSPTTTSTPTNESTVTGTAGPGANPTASPTPTWTPTATATSTTSSQTESCLATTQATLIEVTDGLGHTNSTSFARGTGGSWGGDLDEFPTVSVGTTLSVSVTAEGECPLEYRLMRQPVGGSFYPASDWSSNAQLSYTVDLDDYGMYFTLMVEVRDSDSRTRFMDADDYTYLIYNVDSDPIVQPGGCVATTQAMLGHVTDGLGHTNSNSWARGTGGDWDGGLGESPTIMAGTTLTVTVAASGECPLEYRLRRSPVGGALYPVGDWSSNPTLTYTITPEDYGTYFLLMVEVRDSDPRFRFGDSDDYTYLTYNVDSDPIIQPGSCITETQAMLLQVTDGIGHTNSNSFARGTGGTWDDLIDPWPTVSVGTTLTITATAEGDCPIEYRLMRQPTGGAFNTVIDWTSESTFAYTFTEDDYGLHFSLAVAVRDSDPRNRLGSADDYTYLLYTVE